MTLNLVTGGGGFLGRVIVRQLLERGEAVRVLGRRDYPDLAEQGVQLVRGDVSDPAAVSQACAGCDVVFHVAALPGIWGKRELFERTNWTGTQTVLTACEKAGVKRLIYTSSPSVVFPKGEADVRGADESLPYPQEFGCLYSETKARAESLVLGANGQNLRTVSLRPHLIWGPHDNHLIPRLVARARARRLVQVGAGENRVDLTYVDNAAHAHLLAADALAQGDLESHPVAGKPYFLSDDSPVLLWSWIGALLERLELPPVRRKISYRTAARVGHVFELAYGTLGISKEPPMTRFLAAQLAGDHFFSVEAAKRDFGYSPLVDNETGLQRLVSWVRSTPTY